MPGEVTPTTGDVVWIRTRRWRIERVRLTERSGTVHVVSIGDENVRRAFLTPFDRLWTEGGRARLRHVRWPRVRARVLARSARAGGLRLPLSAIDAAVDILPFQLEAALAFGHGARRVLIADAVGLGKTVQAGLVVAEVLRRTADAWVLILVPASLRDQWAGELSRRFHLTVEHANAETLRRLAADAPRGESPWHAGVWIATSDFLKQAQVFDALPMRPWDLIVIDEAHDAAGPSDRHDACDALGRRSRRVLLLTATPHSGDAVSFDRLRHLGRLAEAPASFDRLVILRRTPAGLGWSTDRRVRWHRVTPSPAERAAFDALLSFEREVLRAADEHRRGAAVLLLSVLRKRALSTMAALAASLRRRAAWLDGSAAIEDRAGWQPRFDFRETQDDALAERDDLALAADMGLERSREQSWIRRLTTLAARAAVDESRVRQVVDLVVRSREPAVVFTEFRDSLAALVARIERRATVTTLHGGQSPAERRAALASYLDGAATVLVATDVAGQGLNLQARGRWVVNFDLPWNPARLSQRAGRVDRIGQTRPVHVTLFSIRHRVEADLIRRLSARAMRAGRALDLDFEDAGWPDERSLGEAVVTGRDVESPTAPLMAVDVTWRRHARWVARDILRRRTWAKQWREWDETLPRPMVSRSKGGRVGQSYAWILVFSTPIVDAAGVVLEISLGAYRVSTSGNRAPARWVADSVSDHARRRAGRRAHRVQRWLERRDRYAPVLDRAIARELERARLARLPQPGLFDRREALDRRARVVTHGAFSSSHAVFAGRAVLLAAIAVDR